MYEKSVKTATGKEYEVRFSGVVGSGFQRVLYIDFTGGTMMDIVPVFANPNETRVITRFDNGERSLTYAGFTNLAEAFIVPDVGNIRIRLDMPIEGDLPI